MPSDREGGGVTAGRADRAATEKSTGAGPEAAAATVAGNEDDGSGVV